jgi:dGTP triphosphohydrolase
METATLEAPVSPIAEAVVAPAPVTEVPEPKFYDLTGDEKFQVRDLENSFLKGSMDMKQAQELATRAQEAITKAQALFPELVKAIASNHNVNTDRFVFDSLKLQFVKRG